MCFLRQRAEVGARGPRRRGQIGIGQADGEEPEGRDRERRDANGAAEIGQERQEDGGGREGRGDCQVQERSCRDYQGNTSG